MTPRRTFLKTVAMAGAAPPVEGAQQPTPAPARPAPPRPAAFAYPRTFRGRQLAMIAFPLGGVGAGSLCLGGRGQLRDWEIFNRADKGHLPQYAFPAIRVQAAGAPAITRVLEARMLPPYEGSEGLGSRNAPGLSRLAGAVFTGEFPLARIDFRDARLPVQVSLEAFTPFIPLEPDDSGLPVAVLRYRVTNPGKTAATVSIAYSIDNPVGTGEKRATDFRIRDSLRGLFMTNPSLDGADPLAGSFALCVLDRNLRNTTWLRGWPRAKWWAAPQLFWDDFSADGELGPEAEARGTVGSLCLKQEIAPGATSDYTFLLGWHFPNRTPERCGWRAPKGHERDVIGNHYCKRFSDAWHAVAHAVSKLADLEADTRRFAAAMRETTLPPAVKDAAMANLSTLVTPTCFRTADGEFHGFEGLNNQGGCCFGNCTHVWNYEVATQHLFPTLARSLRHSAFGYSMDEQGAMHFRQLLPDGFERSGFPAADGQMGQIMKTYIDWRVSGDTEWLRRMWPLVKRALEFAWIEGGWDADRDGVLEGVQHNTYDVEFYGPNPLCGIYYLGALRAGEEMARAAGDSAAADEYHRLFATGSRWIDANLFHGEFYIQKVRGVAESKVAPVLRSHGGAEDAEHPEFQLGDGCLVDQLLGEYLAQLAGLGPLLDPARIRKALGSIYRYNYKRALFDHDCVQRTFALNDEAALVICDYGRGKRPRIPFSYYAEVMTGFEYSAAVLMLFHGMEREGIECIENIRRRYDGERRNPWDEAECGYHYARAMAAWSAIPALSGFRYDAVEKKITAARPGVRSFWCAGSGWGTFELRGGRFALEVLHGTLECRAVEFGAGRVRELPKPVRLGKGERLDLRA